jgi:hypothetical protein
MISTTGFKRSLPPAAATASPCLSAGRASGAASFVVGLATAGGASDVVAGALPLVPFAVAGGVVSLAAVVVSGFASGATSFVVGAGGLVAFACSSWIRVTTSALCGVVGARCKND